MTAQPPPIPAETPLHRVLQTLEEQLIPLDAYGALIAAAHVSAAVEYLRLDLAINGAFPDRTQH